MSNYAKLCLLAAMLVSRAAFGNLAHTVESYIAQYYDLAITEMDRTGVPASIKLSQGILESAYGNSALALHANNHFGIKCHNGWSGLTYWKWDDEEKTSCFREYCSPEVSYIDHSNFLRGRRRYAFLFELQRTDYMAWARGLQRAGYATAPDYADKLIRIIDSYELYRFDLMTNAFTYVERAKSPKPVFQDFAVSHTVIIPPVMREEPTAEIGATPPTHFSYTIKGKAKSKLFPNIYQSGTFTHNNVKMLIAAPKDTPSSIARAQGIPLDMLLAYNDLQPGESLILHQYVYLAPKRSEYRGTQSFYEVSEGETMYAIAQAHGIKLNVLLLRNQMQRGDEAANGEKIYLRGAINKQPKLRK